MKALGKLMTGLMAILMTASLFSCQTDEEIGFDLSGLFGKYWEADLGENVIDRYGYECPIYSEFEFISGNYSDHGIGRERQFFMDNDELYQILDFDWNVQYGDLVLNYGHGDFFWMHDLVTYRDYFTARVDNDNDRTDFYLVGTRATGSDSTKVVKTRKIEGPVQFKAKAKQE